MDEEDRDVVVERVLVGNQEVKVCSIPLLADHPRRGLRSGSRGSSKPQGPLEKTSSGVWPQAPLPPPPKPEGVTSPQSNGRST